MSVCRVLNRLAAKAAVAALVAGYVGLATAADEPLPAAPGVVAGADCPTCAAGPGGAPCRSAKCKSCERRFFGYAPPKPAVGQLRPGACFGYFQTQWHRWEDVCPLPYQGVGLNDVGSRVPPPGPVAVPPTTPAPKTKGTDAPLPLPKAVPMTTPGGLPTVPPPVPNKFEK